MNNSQILEEIAAACAVTGKNKDLAYYTFREHQQKFMDEKYGSICRQYGWVSLIIDATEIGVSEMRDYLWFNKPPREIDYERC